MNYGKITLVGSAVIITVSLSSCAASFEGSGSKDAASAEQLALKTPDPWKESIQVTQSIMQGSYKDGVYSGVGLGVGGPITVTLLIQENQLSCLSITQAGETQSVGGYEAIRDGKYAAMIEAAQGSDIDTIAGATLTTTAVRNAVDQALTEARDDASHQTEGVRSDG